MNSEDEQLKSPNLSKSIDYYYLFWVNPIKTTKTGVNMYWNSLDEDWALKALTCR